MEIRDSGSRRPVAATFIDVNLLWGIADRFSNDLNDRFEGSREKRALFLALWNEQVVFNLRDNFDLSK